jgi:hypothetical protein
MELLLVLGGLYIMFKVGWFAVKALFDVVIGSVKLIAALTVISAIYIFVQSNGLL